MLAIGCALTITGFRLLNALAWVSLPVANPSEVVFVSPVDSRVPSIGSYDESLTFGQDTGLFADVAAVRQQQTSIRRGVDVEPVVVEVVSGNYLGLLGVPLLFGRALDAGDDQAGAEPAVVISESLWRRAFGADGSILGQALDLQFADRRAGYGVVGVIREPFRGVVNAWAGAEVWVTFRRRAEDTRWFGPPVGPKMLVARLSDGATVDRARTYASTWRLPAASTSGRPASTVAVRPAIQTFPPLGGVADATSLAVVLFGLAALVFVACVSNLVGLGVARAIAMQRNVAVMFALGMGARRLWQVVAFEALILTMAGVSAGFLASVALVRIILAGLPGWTGMDVWRSSPASVSAPVDSTVAMFTVCLGVVAFVALATSSVRHGLRSRPAELLGMVSAIVAPRVTGVRLRHWVILPQAATSIALSVIGASALLTIGRGLTAPLGYNLDSVAFVKVDTLGSMFSWKPIDRAAFFDRALLAARSTGFEVALASGTPFDATLSPVVQRDGETISRPRLVHVNHVSAEYFSILDIPLLAGRVFRKGDSADAAGKVVIDTEVASVLWPGRNPLGKHLALTDGDPGPGGSWVEVVGVVGSVRSPQSRGESVPFVYLPVEQLSAPSIVLARGGAPGTAASLLRDAVSSVDPRVGALAHGVLQAPVERMRQPQVTAVTIVGVLAVSAVLVTCVGVFGAVALTVRERTGEIGIRLALGATRTNVVWVILRDVAVVATAASAIGLAISVVLLRMTAAIVGLLSVSVPMVLAVVVLANVSVLLACVPGLLVLRITAASILRRN